jgi:PAS domain S-box-containing protein
MLPEPESLHIFAVGFTKTEGENIRQLVQSHIKSLVCVDCAESVPDVPSPPPDGAAHIVLADSRAADTAFPRRGDIPVIVVLDPLDFDRAADFLAKGAFDCISGEDMSRLPFTVIKALGATENDREGRLRAETALRTSEEKYRTIASAVSEGFWWTDENGLITYASVIMAEWLGCDAEQLVGRPALEFADREYASLSETRRRECRVGSTVRYDYKMRRWDGSALWVIASTRAMADDGGRFIGSLTVFTDITELKNTEEALRRSEQRALELVGELEDVKDDLASEVEALNILHMLSSQYVAKNDLPVIYQETLSGSIALTHADKGCLHLAEDGGSALKLAAHQGFAAAFTKCFDKVRLNGGERIIVEDVRTSPVFAGPQLQVLLEEGVASLQSMPLISGLGALIGVMTTFYGKRHEFTERELRMLDLLAREAADAIERKQMERLLELSEQRAVALVKELTESDRNKNEFMSNLSHELRNPLATLLTGLSVLDMTDKSPATAEIRATVRRQADQLRRLVDDLLDITRISNNRIYLKKESVELTRLIVSAARDYGTFFFDKGISLETEVPDEPLLLDADPVRLTQIIGNLLHNALKYTLPGGSVLLRVRAEDEMACITVSDDGIGISPENLKNIFKPFSQAGRALDRSGGGLGLGLSIVKGIAEQHGGNAEIESGGAGKGTCVTVRLPLFVTPAILEESGRRDAPGRRRGKMILFIDDNRDLVKITCSLLQRYGYEVVSAYTGAEGLEEAVKHTPDIIICDIGLPGMNGHEFARRVRGIEALKNVYMIAISGYALADDEERSKEAGFDCHISKPVQLGQLLRLLESKGNREKRKG